MDKDTPENVKTKTGYDGQDYVLVFSDEFNVDGRTFFEGDDPFWEAVGQWFDGVSRFYSLFCRIKDFHYWATDVSQHVTFLGPSLIHISLGYRMVRPWTGHYSRRQPGHYHERRADARHELSVWYASKLAEVVSMLGC